MPDRNRRMIQQNNFHFFALFVCRCILYDEHLLHSTDERSTVYIARWNRNMSMFGSEKSLKNISQSIGWWTVHIIYEIYIHQWWMSIARPQSLISCWLDRMSWRWPLTMLRRMCMMTQGKNEWKKNKIHQINQERWILKTRFGSECKFSASENYIETSDRERERDSETRNHQNEYNK